MFIILLDAVHIWGHMTQVDTTLWSLQRAPCIVYFPCLHDQIPKKCNLSSASCGMYGKVCIHDQGLWLVLLPSQWTWKQSTQVRTCHLELGRSVSSNALPSAWLHPRKVLYCIPKQWHQVGTMYSNPQSWEGHSNNGTFFSQLGYAMFITFLLIWVQYLKKATQGKNVYFGSAWGHCLSWDW